MLELSLIFEMIDFYVVCYYSQLYSVHVMYVMMKILLPTYLRLYKLYTDKRETTLLKYDNK